MCTQWRIAVRRVWKIPWQTHNRLLPHIANVLPPELWFVKRMIAFVKNALNSPNNVVAYIAGMSQFGSHSVMGCNIRFLQSEFDMNFKEVLYTWNHTCLNDVENKRVAEQVRELINVRDRCHFSGDWVLSKEECNLIINFLCMH